MAQTVAEERYEGLRASVNPQTVRAKGDVRRFVEKSARGELAQQRIRDAQGEAGVPAANGMANAIAFGSVEKEELIGFGNGLIGAEVPHVDPAVGKNELRCRRAFFGALRAATTEARRVPDRDDRSFQKDLDVEFGHSVGLCFPLGPSESKKSVAFPFLTDRPL